MSHESDSGSECSETMDVSSMDSRCNTPETEYTVADFLQLREENKQLREESAKLREETRELKETIKQLKDQLQKQGDEAETRHRQLEGYLQRLLEKQQQPEEPLTSLEKLSQVAKKVADVRGEAAAAEKPAAAKKPATKTATEGNTSNEAAASTSGKGSKRKLPSPDPAKEAETAPEQAPKQPRTTTPTTPKASQIPPVVVRDKESWTRVSALLKREKINFAKAKLIKDGVAVTPATADDHRRMTRVLLREKQEYHTYSLQEERTLRAVIRGIPNGVATEDIAEDLRNQGLTPIAVHRMTSRSTKQQMPLVLVQVPKDQQKVLEITRCCGLVVKTEPQRQQSVASQCHRCQKFGHGQGKCTAQPRCVKCGENHETRTCEKGREAPAKCANCGGPHPASYRGCKAYPKPAPKKAQPPRETTTKRQVTPPKVAPGTSYAEAARPKRAQAGAAKGAQNPSESVDLATLAAQFAKMQEALSLLTTFIKNMPSSLQVNG